MSEKIKANRKVILNKGRGPRYEKQFFFDIQEAILDGFRIADTDTREDVSMRNFKGSIGRAVLYKGDQPTQVVKVEEKATETAPEELTEVLTLDAPLSPDLDTLTKKVELLAYAAKFGIEIPEDVNAPLKIKKLIKEALDK